MGRAQKQATVAELRRALKRTTDFLEGICISTGPAAAAFTRQQLEYIAKARAVLRKGGKR